MNKFKKCTNTFFRGGTVSHSNKMSIICLLLLTTSLIAIGTFTFFTGTKNDLKYLNASDSNLEDNGQNVQYIVKEYDGKVAVFKLIHRNMYSFLYSNNNNNKRLEREIKKIISLLIKNNKMPRNKFT